MPIRDWPSAERPREKLINRGPQALSDAELLAIFCAQERITTPLSILAASYSVTSMAYAA